MKKKGLLAAALIIGATAFAQPNLVSKKGEPMLPEAGDWAIGFNATSWLNYAGNFINGGGNNAPTADWTNMDQAIMGKYYVDATTAYRGRLRIGFGSTTLNNLVDTNSTGFGAPITLNDVSKVSWRNITIGAGLEKRKGNTRIQGFYGGELLISMGGSKTTNEYADKHNDNHTAQWTNDFSNGNTTTSNGARTIEEKNGSTFGVTARGFIGVEVFVFPKLSISGEYGWGLGFSSTGEGLATTEEWGLATSTATSNSLITKETVTGKSSSFGIDTDNSGGQLNIIFHF